MKIANIHVCANQNFGPYLDNRRRKIILKRISDLTKNKVDLFILPGGFFIADKFLGKSNFAERKEYLEKMTYTTDLKELLKDTKAVVIAGVDSKQNNCSAKGDQMCVAWDKNGILGIGRKVWTVKGEEGDNYIVNFEDFGSKKRLIKVKGKNILLCSCYDAYGTEGKCIQQNNRLKYDKNIFYNGEVFLEKGQMEELRAQGQQKWNSLLKQADIAACAIHYFSKRGPQSGKSYWVRALRARSKSNFAILGAAHFEEMNMDKMSRANLFAAKNKKNLVVQSAEEVYDKNGQIAIIRIYDVN